MREIFCCFEIIGIVRGSSQPISLKGLASIRLVHFRANMCTKCTIASLSIEIGCLEECTKLMISTVLREIEWLEMYTLQVTSKYLKISFTSKVYYSFVSRVFDHLRVRNGLMVSCRIFCKKVLK